MAVALPGGDGGKEEVAGVFNLVSRKAGRLPRANDLLEAVAPRRRAIAVIPNNPGRRSVLANGELGGATVTFELAVSVSSRLAAVDGPIQTQVDAESSVIGITGKWVVEAVGGRKNSTARTAGDRSKTVARRETTPLGVAYDPGGWGV